MSATGLLESSITKHLIYLERYAAGVSKEKRALFTELARDTKRLLAGDLTSFERTRVTATLRQLNVLIDGVFDQYDAAFLSDMQELAEYELEFVEKAVAGVMTVPLSTVAPERLNAMLTKSKMKLISGKQTKEYTVDGMLAQFRKATKDKAQSEMRSIINAGIANGESASAISRRVADSVSSTMGRGLVRQWSETNVLTATAHISQEAMNETVHANSDLFDEEKWSSTLDGKTSLVCISRDQRRYKVGEGDYPLAHYRCRSRRVPVIPERYAIMQKSERASMNGPVDSRVTYGGWLGRQSPVFQDDVLGVERAKLFRSGEVSVKDFTDNSGKTLTLKQLKEKEGISLE